MRRTPLSVLVCILTLVFISGVAVAIGSLSGDSVKVVSPIPEYTLTLREVVMSTSISDPDLRLQDSLVVALPEYTRVNVLVPDVKVAGASAWLSNKPYAKRIRLLPFDTEIFDRSLVYFISADLDRVTASRIETPKRYPSGSVWAQDLFEPVLTTGGIGIIESDAYKYYYSKPGENHVLSDNSFLDSLSRIVSNVHRSKLSFSGGNIAVDSIDGKHIVYCGSDLIKKTLAEWVAIYDIPGDAADVTKMIGKSFRADRIVVMGPESGQPTLLFHLDQAFVLFWEGLAGVTRIVGQMPDDHQSRAEIEAAQDFLQEVRSVLSRDGYAIVDLLTSTSQALRRQFPANAVPFVHAESRRRSVLLPVFTSSAGENWLNEENQKQIEAAGIDVIPVESDAFERLGGLHCLINVIQ